MVRVTAGLAGVGLAVLVIRVAGPASAEIIRGYADLYATSLQVHVTDGSGGDNSGGCVGEQAPCAKVRFNFEYDTSLPPYQMKANFVFLKRFDERADWSPEPGWLFYDVEDIRYLVYGPWGMNTVFNNQLDPGGHPYCHYERPEQDELSVGAPGEPFDVTFNARYQHGMRFNTGSGYQTYYCTNEQKMEITDNGGYFIGLSEDFPPSHLTDVPASISYTYLFDNRPENWVDGPPEARVWVTNVPEPASLSLLAVGLAALSAAGGRAKGR